MARLVLSHRLLLSSGSHFFRLFGNVFILHRQRNVCLDKLQAEYDDRGEVSAG